MSLRDLSFFNSPASSSSPMSSAIAQQGVDIVAHIAHNPIPDHCNATFKRYRSVARANDFTYAIDLPGERNDNVVFLGKENETAQFGYDYMVAVVNKRTGLADFVPVKLVNFERAYSNDPNLLLGIKPPPKADYSADNASTTESWAEKRRALTAEFGSAKKIKMQESANRRIIKEETLKTMMDNSAFFSPEGAAGDEVKSSPIALLVKPVSDVLPKANENAKTPQEVYSFSLFLTDEELADFKKSALEYMNRSKEDLLGAGFPNLILQLAGELGADGRRAAFVLLLATMAAYYKLVAKPQKHVINDTEFFSVPYPPEYQAKIRELFFTGDFEETNARRKSKGKMYVNSAEKDKLLSHILCLVLLLDNERMSIPITPWARILSCPEGRISKVATGLGCSVISATPAESVRVGTVHIAKLVGPPSAKKNWKTPRRR